MAIAAALLISACTTVGAYEDSYGQSYYPEQIPRKEKGDFIFFTNEVFTDEAKFDLYYDYIKQFRVALTNGYINFEGEQLKELHDAGVELFIYRWFNGYYEEDLALDGEPTVYMKNFPEIMEQKRAVHAHPEWLLNPEEPMKGSGAVYPAYFYDYANPEFRTHYANQIAKDLEESDYDGVFFDYIGSWALPAPVKKLWGEKYPGMTYDDASLLFLEELDAAIGERKIFGNQTYRLPSEYYDYVDYDVSESLGVSFVWGKEAEINLEGEGMVQVDETFRRLWDGPSGYKNIIRMSSADRRKPMNDPRVEVFDINYLQPKYVPNGRSAMFGDLLEPEFTKRTDKASIFYGYVLSKLIGGSSFASDWYAAGFGKSDIYFLDLGEQLGEDYVEHDECVVRYFQNGFVIVSKEASVVRFAPDEAMLPETVTTLWDMFEGSQVYDWGVSGEVTIFPDYYPATESHYPAGRVFVYLHESFGQGGNQ